MKKNDILITKTSIIKNLVWKFLERMSSQMMTFIVSLVLARLLSPSDYGIIAIINMFIAIANTLVTSGFSSALIQKKDADNIDFSSVFFLNMLSSFALYFILFVFADKISIFYEIKNLSIYIRVLGLQIILYSLNSVQQAYISRNMLFKNYFFSTLGGTLLSGAIGILMAYFGMGVWALIVQILLSSAINAAILWFMVKWRPQVIISFKRLKELLGFGWKMLCSAIVSSIYEQFTGLVIGKVYSEVDLAYYNRGQNYPSLVVTNINSTINSILFPAIANVQDNKTRVKIITRRSIQISLFLIAPMLIGLASVGTPLIRLMLTEKWLPCVPYLQLFCLYYIVRLIPTANLLAIQAMGKSSLFLAVEIIKDLIGVLLLIFTIKKGVYAMTLSIILTSCISMVIVSIMIFKILNYNFKEQLSDIVPYILFSAIMAIPLFFLKFFVNDDIILIACQIIVGVIIYIILAFLFQPEAFKYLVSIIKNKKSKSLNS